MLAGILLAVAGCAPGELLERLKPGGSGALERGIELFNSGEFKAARPLLEKGLTENPSDPNAHLYVGLALLKAKESQSARTHFEAALKLAPKNEKALFYLAELARERRDFQAADKHLRAALAVSPKNFAILNNLGLVSCEQKKYKEAIGFYSQALEQNSKSFVTFYNLGEAYRKSEQYPSALKIFQDAHKLQPDNVYLAFSMGETYFYLKRYEDALRQYQKVLTSPARFDQAGRVLFQMGVIQYNENRLSQAMGHFELAAKSNFDRSLVLLWQAKVEIRQRHYREALELLELAERARSKTGKGNPAQIEYYKGVVNLNLDRFDEAIPAFKSALLFDLPRDRIFAQLGTAHLKKALALPSTAPDHVLEEMLSQASENFEKCLALDKENLVSLLGLAQVQFLRKDYEKGLERAGQALAVSKDFPPALLQQALCNCQLKRMPEAIGGLEACLVLEPANTNVMFFLAQLYAQMGRFADAEALFQRGLAIEPNNMDAMLLLGSVFARTGRYKDSAIMLQRILDSEGDVQVKKDARELYALVSKTYRDIVDLSKTGLKVKLGTMEYVEKRLAEPRALLDRAAAKPLTPEERLQLQEMVDRLVIDHNYFSQNNLFKTPESAAKYNEGLKELVARMQKL
ncbi:MAG: tetratricopeptide repeat protein [Candidatus Wallbacteria bacterium]|nr:tetratricopeptide repeat protein [Candidatus Wallbacteria bacterium]